MSLLPVESALFRVLATLKTVARHKSLRVDLMSALHHILAEDITATINVPGTDNSAMDGYALRLADTGKPLPISQRIPAGTIGTSLQPGTAARIFTGATIPDGADVVVMQENCQVVDGTVIVGGSLSQYQNIRPKGQDVALGDLVLAAGRRLRPQDLGLLASVGVSRVLVYKPLKVAILSTGDELVDPESLAPGTALGEGQLFNSNRYTLAGLLRGLNMEVLDCGIVPDNASATALALKAAAEHADCVISSGGVSVGEEDHVKAQVEKLGQLQLWKLAIKPGKPLAFGHIGDTPFFGLPGNPTSVFVTFCLIARPFLLQLQGVVEPETLSLFATAEFTNGRSGVRQEYRRVLVRSTSDGLQAQAFPNQSSGVLSSVSHSNALAVIPPRVLVEEGDMVEIILLDQLS
jgi:molybdopterin molybdotransferase